MGAFDDIVDQQGKDRQKVLDHLRATAERIFADLEYPREQWEEQEPDSTISHVRVAKGGKPLESRRGQENRTFLLYLRAPRELPMSVAMAAWWGPELTFSCNDDYVLEAGGDYVEFFERVKADLQERARRMARRG